jgi:peptidoglycan biosynthesis protein MviN/MurJ (putative lipid II flippase)
MVVILGRTGRTERSFPATVAGMLVNVALNLALVPPLGIVGAGLALAGSYLVVIVLMYAFTHRLFPVPYEWGRLGMLVGVTATVIAAGELLLPKDGISAWVTRIVAWLALPLALWALGFLTAEERRSLRDLLSVRAVREHLRAAGSGESSPDEDRRHLPPEVYEQALRDEDRM